MDQLNNRVTRKFILATASVPLSMLALMWMSTGGFDIPILRQVTGFILLTLIPGFLILRILRLHNLGVIETLAYSVGLSIAFVMFLGLIINVTLPLIGIPNPISTYPVIISISTATLILCLIAYKSENPVDEQQFKSSSAHLLESLSSPVLFLLLLPILAILGTQLVYSHLGNTVLIILLLLIASIPILIAFNKFIPSRLYPLAIITISIALLWHLSLISTQLTGGDIFYEYLIQQAPLDNYVWDSNRSGILNAMLSVVILPPVYSITLNIESVWVYKVIYPMFYCLVPLVLFQVYRKQIDNRLAFFAAFFFMSFLTFVTQVYRPRMEVAELFFVLLMLLFFQREINAPRRVGLFIIFGFSLIVSHYATSYLFLFYLIMVLPVMFLMSIKPIKRLLNIIARRFLRFPRSDNTEQQLFQPIDQSPSWSRISRNYVYLFVVFCLTWYMFVASGSPFNAIVRVVNHVVSFVYSEFFSLGAIDPQILQAFGLASMRSGEIEWEIARILQYITQLFIVVGIMWLLTKWDKTRFHPEYAAMSIVSMILLAAAVFLPYLSTYMQMFRLYHTTLLFLAPFCIFGGILFTRWLLKIISLKRLRGLDISASLRIILLLVLVPYFLFGSGVIFELTGATATSLPLSLYKEDWRLYKKTDILACQWIKDAAMPGYTIYTDMFGNSLFIADGVFPRTELPGQLAPNEYLFLRYWNVEHSLFLDTGGQQGITRGEHVDLRSGEGLVSVTNNSKIYTNGSAEIFGP